MTLQVPVQPYGALPLEDERPLELYPMAAMALPAPTAVKVNLGITHLGRRYYTQRGGLCTSFSLHQQLTFFNGRLYHPGKVFFAAGGHPNSGAHTAAVMDVARKLGTVTVRPPYPALAPEDDGAALPWELGEGIKENRWLSRTGDQALQDVRTSLGLRVPVLFILPMFGTISDGAEREFWKCPAGYAAPSGWHQISLTYASDAEGIVGSDNSWGDGPMFCSTYEELIRLVNVHQAYGTIVTDTITGTEGPMPDDQPVPPTPTPQPDPQPRPRLRCPHCDQTFKPTRTGDRKRREHVRREHRRRHNR